MKIEAELNDTRQQIPELYRSTTSSNLSSSCIRDHCSHKPKAACLNSKKCKVLLQEYSLAMSIFTTNTLICYNLLQVTLTWGFWSLTVHFMPPWPWEWAADPRSQPWLSPFERHGCCNTLLTCHVIQEMVGSLMHKGNWGFTFCWPLHSHTRSMSGFFRLIICIARIVR